MESTTNSARTVGLYPPHPSCGDPCQVRSRSNLSDTDK